MNSVSRQQLPRLFLLSSLLLLSACKLSITLEGNGAGEVTSESSTIQCGNVSEGCIATFGFNETALLTAQPKENSHFVGWSNAGQNSTCNDDSITCSVTMNQDQVVTARFEKITDEDPELYCGEVDAKAECLTPKQSAEYYIDQSIKYFLTMESSVSPFVIPNYAEKVVRWEWPPWLLLTGYGQANMIWTDILLKLNPTAYASIDCQAFDTQPFGRCHVVFDYAGELCPIYEEFAFNDQGEITFIEAWTDAPGWLPMEDGDYWAEGDNVDRLSTRVPGLGNETGSIDLDAEWMNDGAAQDADVAEFVRRAKKPYKAWIREMLTHVEDVRGGCHPNE